VFATIFRYPRCSRTRGAQVGLEPQWALGLLSPSTCTRNMNINLVLFVLWIYYPAYLVFVLTHPLGCLGRWGTNILIPRANIRKTCMLAQIYKNTGFLNSPLCACAFAHLRQASQAGPSRGFLILRDSVLTRPSFLRGD
jgi:hypothetical protein